MKGVVILGSTGSIGRSSLDVLDGLPGSLSVVGLSAGRNAELLCEQASRYRPELVGIMGEELINDLTRRGYRPDLVGIMDEQLVNDLTRRLAPLNVKVIGGLSGLFELVQNPKVDLIINALAGGVGLMPTLKAIEAGKDVAMANKEPLVMAGEILVRQAREHKAALLPLDSEPSALWQCLQSNLKKNIRRIILTASGGPFLDRPNEDLKSITPDEALNHPTWKMGRKVTVDSATLMNKGFEVIESHCLFEVPISQIEVVIHRQSIVHALVEFTDGSIVAQLSQPDMRLPIQYALTYPERLPTKVEHLNLAKLGELTFAEPDFEKFPCLGLSYRAAETGGTMPAVLNAANEVAVDAFLAGRISFLDIPRINQEAMTAHQPVANPGLDDILRADQWARELAQKKLGYQQTNL